jgi:hypothetical protein
MATLNQVGQPPSLAAGPRPAWPLYPTPSWTLALVLTTTALALPLGSTFPNAALIAQNGEAKHLSDLWREKPVLLVFLDSCQAPLPRPNEERISIAGVTQQRCDRPNVFFDPATTIRNHLQQPTSAILLDTNGALRRVIRTPMMSPPTSTPGSTAWPYTNPNVPAAMETTARTPLIPASALSRASATAAPNKRSSTLPSAPASWTCTLWTTKHATRSRCMPRVYNHCKAEPGTGS